MISIRMNKITNNISANDTFCEITDAGQIVTRTPVGFEQFSLLPPQFDE